MTTRTADRTLRHYDVLRTNDVVIDSDGDKWQIMDDEGGVLTVQRPNGSVSQMMPSVLFIRGKRLIRA